MQIPAKDEMLFGMGRQNGTLGRFVRLNLNGEIIEVVGYNSIELVVNFKGTLLTMSHDEVTRISPEEVAEAEKRFPGLDLR